MVKANSNNTVTVNIGISDKNRKAVCAGLQGILADEFLLYSKTRSYHWNVEGPHFGALHKLFEEQYDALSEIVDEVAERIRQLGHYADGTLSTCQKQTRLKESAGAGLVDVEMLRDLTADHETVIRNIREVIDETDETYKDAGTADFLTGVMEQHEKMAWMLRAHIAK